MNKEQTIEERLLNSCFYTQCAGRQEVMKVLELSVSRVISLLKEEGSSTIDRQKLSGAKIALWKAIHDLQ